MNRLLLIPFSLFLLFGVVQQPLPAQSDARAQSYIDRLKRATASPDGWKARFLFVASETAVAPDLSSGREGFLFVLGSRYKIQLSDMELFFDGKQVAQYLADANELTLSKAEDFFDPEDLSLFNPLKLFDVQGRDFAMQFLGNTTVNGGPAAEVLLKPRKETNRYESVLLTIDEKSALPLRLKITRKGGGEQLLQLTLPVQSEKITDSMVTFQPAAHPGVETIDMR
ncbi:MAG: outer membrane lipoprotein carrier protein LolA [Bacteroidales bacterium]